MYQRLVNKMTTALCVCSIWLSAGQSVHAQRAAWYSFNDGTAVDVSGNGHDGMIVGGPVAVVGPVRRGLSFDGVDDYITIPDDAALQLDQLTLSTWLWLDVSPATDQVLISKTLGMNGYRLGIRGDTRAIEFEIREESVGGVILSSHFGVPIGVWTHIAASYDGEFASLSIDGEMVASRRAPGIPLAGGGDIGVAAALDSPGASKLFRGGLDEVLIVTGASPQAAICRQAQKLWDRTSRTCISPFVDITARLGVGDEAHGHFAITLVDVNDDGWLDLYYANGAKNVRPVAVPPTGTCPVLSDPPLIDPGNVNVIYMNRGDGTFDPDAAPDMGLDDFWFAMRNVWGDYDNDGRRDLLSHNFLRSPLYHAVPGSDPLVFEDASESSGLVACLTKGTGASWADVDNDGWLDAFVTEYNAALPPEDNLYILFQNNRNGTFSDVTADSGITEANNPMGIAFADFDNDGDQDVFMANSPPVPTRLYRNDGVDPATGVVRFTDVAPDSGVAILAGPEKGIGAAWGDFNNDQLLDLLLLRESDSRLFRNDGPISTPRGTEGTDEGVIWSFTDVTGIGGLDLAGLSFADGNFADLDNDGWLDIVVTGGFKTHGPNRVFLNNGDETWREVAALLGLEFPAMEQTGYIAGDIDNDGDLDLSIMSVDTGAPNFLFQNLTRGNAWVQFRLTGTISNRDAVGARITVEAVLTPGGPVVSQIREVFAGTGFFSDFPRIQTIGLGKAPDVVSAIIQWPSGIVQDLGSIAINQRYDIVESER